MTTTWGVNTSLATFNQLAVFDVPVTIGGHCFEQAPVVGYEQNGMGESLERCFELLYCREVEMVGRFI